MPFHIVQNDITRMRVDAIVNAANTSLLGGGGVDGAIHRAAGPELLEYCRTLGGCQVGEAKLSPGFKLPAKWIIHTVGPVWCGGNRGEAAFLAACYRNSLNLALSRGFETVAFPLISGGAFGYPKDQALDVAVREIQAFLEDHELTVWLVVFDRTSYQLSTRLMEDVRSYLDDNYVNQISAESEWNRRPEQREWALESMSAQRNDFGFPGYAQAFPTAASKPAFPAEASAKPEKPKKALRRKKTQKAAQDTLAAPMQTFSADLDQDLDHRLKTLDESFSQMLLRKIDEKGMTDAACYKKANVDRKLFSKIRSDPWYRPSKPTVLAFAVALELPLEEARELLMKAGFALSHSNKFDVILEYFISRGKYDIYEINETLFAFDQTLLGA